ncbi:hypothetical protein C8R48DRAFT_677146 [Suillus tomentosus]|nr:hypothetical protein C8R48DRAFT_677146 [Suillus tomentosus]
MYLLYGKTDINFTISFESAGFDLHIAIACQCHLLPPTSIIIHHTEHQCSMSANLQYILGERQQICDTCGCSFKPKGFNSHRRACEQHMRDSEEDAEQWASIPAMSIQAVGLALTIQAAHDDGKAWQDYNYDHDNGYNHHNADIDMSSDHSEPEDAPGHTINDIRTEFYPHARTATRVEAFSNFTRHHRYEPPCPECQPWLPFSCQLDFEVAELAHKAALTPPMNK